MLGSNSEARITCSLTGGTSRKSLLPGILFVYVLNGDQDNFYVSLEEMAIHSSILPGKFHGQSSLESYSPQGRKELDTTEQLTHFV